MELLHGEIPSRVDLHDFHQKGHRQTDRPTDMCNPTDAIASKKSQKVMLIVFRVMLFLTLFLYTLASLKYS